VLAATLNKRLGHLNQAEEGDIKMSIAAELGYPDKDDYIDNQFIKDAISLYELEHLSPDAINTSYLGSSEQDDSEFPSIALRNFVMGGKKTKHRMDTILGGLFIKSREFKNKEEEQIFLKSLSAAKSDEAVEKIISEQMYGLGDTDKEAVFFALNKLKKINDNLYDVFENLAARQNPVVAKMQELKGFNEESLFQEELYNYFGWTPDEEENYPKIALINDLEALASGRAPSDTLMKKIEASSGGNELDPLNETVAFIRGKHKDPEAYKKNVLLPAIKAMGGSSAQELSTANNRAARAARSITLEAFFKKNRESFTISDCIPIGANDNIEKKAHNMDKMLSFAFGKLESTDKHIAALFRHNPAIKGKISDELKNKLVLNPSKEMLLAIESISNLPASLASDRTPNARDEEQLSKIAEDTIYNTIFREIGGLDIAKSFGAVNISAVDAINIYENVTTGAYDAIGGPNGDKAALKKARDLFSIMDIFERTQQGKYSREDAEKKMKALKGEVLTPSEMQGVATALSSSLSTFFDRKEAQFNSENYGISRDETQANMNLNGSLLERQAREIHKTLYGDKILDKMLGTIGLAREGGKSFIQCVDSGKNATIKSHSPGHEFKACIDKLVEKYERSGSEALRDIGNPVVAASGIAGWMVLFSIFEKAAAHRLKGMAAAMELERNRDLTFMSSAKNGKEMVAHEAVIRNKHEKITEEVVAAPEMDSYIREMLWANHMYEFTSNSYLRHNGAIKDILNAAGSIKLDGDDREHNAKIIAAYPAIEEILKNSGLDGDIKEFLQATKVQERQEYLLKKLKLDSLIVRSAEDGNLVALIALQNKMVDTMREGILSGAEAEVDDPNNKGKVHALIDKQAQSGKQALEILKNRVGKIEEEVKVLLENKDALDSESLNVLIAKQEELGDLRLSIPALSKMVQKMEAVTEEILHIESVTGDRSMPFSAAYSAFDSKTDLANRYGGYVSSPAFAGQDLMRLDRFNEWLQQNKPGHSKSGVVGEAVAAVKGVIRMTMLQQKAEKQNKTLRESFDSYETEHKKDALNGSDIKFHSVKQNDGSYQVVMFNKASLENVKDLSHEGKSLYSSLQMGSRNKKDIEVEITEKRMGEGEARDFRQQHASARETLAVFSEKSGISRIGEDRYADVSKNKGLSNKDSFGAKNKGESSLFAQYNKLRKSFSGAKIQ
jgi:hypothetical protein